MKTSLKLYRIGSHAKKKKKLQESIKYCISWYASTTNTHIELIWANQIWFRIQIRFEHQAALIPHDNLHMCTEYVDNSFHKKIIKKKINHFLQSPLGVAKAARELEHLRDHLNLQSRSCIRTNLGPTIRWQQHSETRSWCIVCVSLKISKKLNVFLIIIIKLIS